MGSKGGVLNLSCFSAACVLDLYWVLCLPSDKHMLLCSFTLTISRGGEGGSFGFLDVFGFWISDFPVIDFAAAAAAVVLQHVLCYQNYD